jgi:hypothetical protein
MREIQVIIPEEGCSYGLAPTIAQLKNAHTIVFLPLPPACSEFTDFLQSGGKIFPLSIDWYEGRVILSESYTSKKLPLGGERYCRLMVRIF